MREITYRSKDFYMMEVRDEKGKKLGFIKDIDINFSEGSLVSFVLSSSSILHIDEDKKIEFFTRPHKIILEDYEHEEIL